MSSDNYVKEAMKTVKDRVKKDEFEFNRQLSDTKYSPRHPFSSPNYRPELDTSCECTDGQVTFYQNLIGILRWIVELGKFDILFEVSCLSSYLASPRIGHIVQALHIFKYLKLHTKHDLAFDPMYQKVESDQNIERKIASNVWSSN